MTLQAHMWLQSSFNIVWNLGWLFKIPYVSCVCDVSVHVAHKSHTVQGVTQH